MWSAGHIERQVGITGAPEGSDSITVQVQLGYFYWYTFLPRVGTSYVGRSEGGYEFYRPVAYLESCDSDLSQSVFGYEETRWSLLVGPSSEVTFNISDSYYETVL